MQTEVDKSTKQEYWQLRPENAYVPKGQAEPQLCRSMIWQSWASELKPQNQPALITRMENQPTGFFRNLIDSLYQAAIDDTRTSHALVKHNYQRLLDKIDSGSDRYSPMEYWRALHNPDYRDVIQKTIVKHPSDWYFKRRCYLATIPQCAEKDAPEWKKYSEDFIDKMAWMQDVTSEKLGPSLWHMHPLKILASLIQTNVNIRILRLRAFLRMIRIGEGPFRKTDTERCLLVQNLQILVNTPIPDMKLMVLFRLLLELINFYTGHGEICNVDILSQISVRVIKTSVV